MDIISMIGALNLLWFSPIIQVEVVLWALKGSGNPSEFSRQRTRYKRMFYLRLSPVIAVHIRIVFYSQHLNLGCHISSDWTHPSITLNFQKERSSILDILAHFPNISNIKRWIFNKNFYVTSITIWCFITADIL